jgi:hypothetical protein
MRDRLLIAWIASLGVTRVDLLGGMGDFLLTPFLVLVPALAIVEIGAAVRRGGRFRLPERGGSFFPAIALLLSVVLLSTFLSHDLETSLRRTLLLYLQVFGVLVGALAFGNHERPREILRRGAVGGLALAVVFNLLQLLHWFRGSLVPGEIGRFVMLEPGNYAGVIPRLTASSHDPNLGGLLLLCYMFLVIVLEKEGRWRTTLLWLGGISILLTFSRSAVLAAIAVIAVSVALRPRRAVTARGLVIGSSGVAAVALGLVLFPATIDALVLAWEVLSGRLSLEEGSTSEHAAVLSRGWEVATYDAKQFLIGIGYGNAYTTLHDIFPGNRYGNYHSLFLTLFAESGVFAALLGIGIFGWAFLVGGTYRPIVAGLIMYNLFQQSQTDPITWLLICLAWTRLGDPALDGTGGEESDEGAGGHGGHGSESVTHEMRPYRMAT